MSGAEDRQAEQQQARVAEQPSAPQSGHGKSVPPQRPGDSGRSPLRGYLMTAGAIAFCALLGVVATSGLGGAGDPSPGKAELSQMEANLALMQSEGLDLPPVAASERAKAIDGMGLNAEQKAQVEQSVSTGASELVWVTVWDNMDEDGDIVSVESDWFSARVPITHAQTTVAVPRPSSGVINIRGTHDGGGGVTMSFVVKGVSLPVPPLSVGSAIGVKVR